MSPIQNASLLLIQTLFDLYLLALLLRLILQYLRVDYYNPLTQFLVKLTNPVVVPLRRFIPGYFGIDFATLIGLIGLTFCKLILLTLINAHKFPMLLGLLIWTFADLIQLTINLYFYAILISIVISWLQPRSHSPVGLILYQLTEPLLRPARRFIPPIAGFDITPIPVMLALQLIIILITQPLTKMGIALAFR